jgi:hypothetical protein
MGIPKKYIKFCFIQKQLKAAPSSGCKQIGEHLTATNSPTFRYYKMLYLVADFLLVWATLAV